jgi:transcriptional regulator with XRE-family HTH domain
MIMGGSIIGERIQSIRRLRTWTQGRLAEEAGLSPTTVSGIETGRIARPHFGTLHRLAHALEVDPHMLLSSEEPTERASVAPLSLSWARPVKEEEFERELKDSSLDRLASLFRELNEERERLQRLYGELPEGSEQRRFIKPQIREVSAQAESVMTSAMFHRDGGAKAHTDKQKEVVEEPRREGV